MKSFFSPRVRCFLRREFPLLGFLILLIAGQTVGYLLLVDWRFAWLLPILFLLGRRGIAAFALGLITMIIAVTENHPPPPENNPLLATVVEEPRYRAPGAVELGLEIANFGLARCRTVHLPWRNIHGITVGDTFLFSGKILPIKLPLNPFSYDANLRHHGYIASCKITTATPAIKRSSNLFSEYRSYIFEQINQRFGMGNREGLFLSMVLGYRDLIGDHIFRAFQQTGLAHLLVVSGFHVTLIFSLILWIFRLIAARLLPTQPNIVAVILITSCLCAVLFVLLIGIDGASLRAAVAIIIISLCRIFERGQGMAHGIMAALLMLIIIWPGCFLEPGIQLTFAALIGIAYGLNVKVRWPWQRTLITLIAPSIATFGISVLWFESASLIGFLLNPLLAPLASIFFTVGGLIALTAFLSGVDAAGYLLAAVLWLIELFAKLVIWCSELPGASIALEGSTGMIIGSLAILAAFYFLLKRTKSYLIEMGIA